MAVPQSVHDAWWHFLLIQSFTSIRVCTICSVSCIFIEAMSFASVALPLVDNRRETQFHEQIHRLF